MKELKDRIGNRLLQRTSEYEEKAISAHRIVTGTGVIAGAVTAVQSRQPPVTAGSARSVVLIVLTFVIVVCPPPPHHPKISA